MNFRSCYFYIAVLGPSKLKIAPDFMVTYMLPGISNMIYEILEYTSEAGKNLFHEWFSCLEARAAAKVTRESWH